VGNKLPTLQRQIDKSIRFQNIGARGGVMGWLMNKINRLSSDKQRDEMTHFVDMLRAMDSAELGHVVAIATHMRHTLESEGHNVMDPIVYAGQNIGFPLFLSKSINEAQKQSRMQDAAALMVWVHTRQGWCSHRTSRPCARNVAST